MSKDKERPPSPDEFSSGVIQKSVFSEAIQHPTTLFPAAVSILSGLYMGLFTMNETTFALCLGSGLASIISWVYHYFIRGEELAEKHVKELLARRKRFKEQEGHSIETRCRDAGFTRGAEAAADLDEAYKRLDSFLKEKFKKKQNTTASRFLVLAEESFYQGVQFLDKALSLHKALVQIDANKLKQELDSWTRHLAAIEKKGSQKDQHDEVLVTTLKEKIASHNKRLELFSVRQKTLEQVLSQCEILEATLDTTYLEVVDLIQDDANLNRTGAASDLERAVTAARRVEDRLRGLGKENDDSQYETRL